MTGKELAYYRVWDVPTRLFHWVNFACVLILIGLGTALVYNKSLGISTDGKILLKTTHVWVGYVFAVNLLWRLVWAFIGNRHARWSAIVPFRRGYFKDLKGYVVGTPAGNGRLFMGHTPVARVAVFVLLVLLVVQGSTGLILAGTDIYYPPFGHWIASWVAAEGVDAATIVPYDKTGVDLVAYEAMRSLRSPVITTHYWVFIVLLGAIAVHIAAVVLSEIFGQGGIVSAMFTGKKVFDQRPVDDDEPHSDPG